MNQIEENRKLIKEKDEISQKFQNKLSEFEIINKNKDKIIENLQKEINELKTALNSNDKMITELNKQNFLLTNENRNLCSKLSKLKYLK